MLYELGRPEEALDCYDRALEINPSDAVVWVKKKGMALADLARQKEALTALEQSRKLFIAAGASGARVEQMLAATEQARRSGILKPLGPSRYSGQRRQVQTFRPVVY